MKVGFVAIIGRPNVGKSTLLNQLINYDLAIISPLPQTTRDVIVGVYNDDNSQIIFQDTPGMHKAKSAFGETLNDKAKSTIRDSEVVLFLQPINEQIGPGDKFIINDLIATKTKAKKVAIITKLDASDAKHASERATELKELGFTDVVGVSMKMKGSILHLIDFLKDQLPEGIPYFEVDEITTAPLRFIVSEQIRSAALGYLKDEIPHSLRVEITSFIEPQSEDKLYTIAATLFVERESQKGIVIGESGAMIRLIGTQARKVIQQSLDGNVRLDLQVKVDKKWTNLKSPLKAKKNKV